MAGTSTNEHASGSKSSTVCFLCRQRKTKCDRKLPRCGFCVKAKVNCQYVTKPKKRGLRAGYVSELEGRLEVVENELQTLKRSSGPHITETQDFSPDSVAAAPSISRSENTPSRNAAQLNRIPHDPATDLRSLPLALIHHLIETWFKDCQPWAPIIRRPDIQDSLLGLVQPIEQIECIVLRAVLALTISYSSQVINCGYEGRRRLSRHLRSEVLSEALANVSLKSLQALLIICILDYGSDDVASSWSLLSVCRRMCEQLGLFKVLLSQMELQTPTNIGPPTREVFEGQELAVPLTWVTLCMDSAWTLGAGWRDASASLMENLSSIAYLTAPDFSDSFRTFTHLGAIGLQPLHTLFWEHAQHKDAQAEAVELATCDDIYQNLSLYTRSQTLPTYSLLPDGSIDFDPNAVLTNTLSNGAIVVLYQPHINLAEMSLAHQRCIAACDDMITTIRTVSDADIEFNSPSLGAHIFAAARFKLALYKTCSQPREARFDVLMHGLNMCGRRWMLARRCDIVLRAAILEVDATVTGGVITHKPLPEDFWDLAQSAVDINEGLRRWVAQYNPSLFVGSVNGPYE